MKHIKSIDLKAQSLAVLAAVCIFSVLNQEFASAAISGVSNTSQSGILTELKPIWSVETGSTDKEKGMSRSVAFQYKGVVVTQKNGQLIALQTRTGKQLWSYGAHFKSHLTSDSENIYAVTTDGQLVCVSLNGKLKWRVAINTLKSSDRLMMLDHLYVITDRTIKSFSQATGKLLWKSVEPEGTTYPLNINICNDVLIAESGSQGAFSTTDLYAYDRNTGRKLWTLRNQHLPLSIFGGDLELYTQTEDIPLPLDAADRTITFKGIDLDSGKVRKTRVYQHTLEDTQGRAGGYAPSAVIDLSRLYIFWGDEIGVYDIGSASTDLKPISTLPQPENLYPTGEIKYGQLMVTDQQGHLSGIHTATGKHVIWDGEGTPSYTTDIMGRGLYEKYEDGLLKAFDLRNGQPVFTANTGAGEIVSILRTGTFLVVEKDGKLLGFNIPEQLQ